MGFFDRLRSGRRSERGRREEVGTKPSIANETILDSDHPSSPSSAQPSPAAPTRAELPARRSLSASLDDSETIVDDRPARNSRVIGVLVAVQGPDQGRVFTLNGERETLIGRGKDSDLKLSCRSISRLHAKIVFDGEDLILLSLKDENLASIDGEPTQGAELSDGCLVGLGSDTQLRFRTIEEP